MPVLLGAFISLFKIWMIIDAIGRRGCCNNQWYFIIIFVPFGEWIYFFAVKIHDPQWRRLSLRFRSNRSSLDKLRYDAEHCASHTNRLRYAQGLFDSRREAEALQVVESLLTSDPREKEARYVKARCLLQLDRASEGTVILEELVTQDLHFHNHEPVMVLADTYSRLERHDDAIRVLERLVRSNNRVKYALALGRELAYAHRFEDAKSIVEKSIEDAKFAPSFVRRQDRKDFREAESLLRRLRSALPSA